MRSAVRAHRPSALLHHAGDQPLPLRRVESVRDHAFACPLPELGIVSVDAPAVCWLMLYDGLAPGATPDRGRKIENR